MALHHCVNARPLRQAPSLPVIPDKNIEPLHAELVNLSGFEPLRHLLHHLRWHLGQFLMMVNKLWHGNILFHRLLAGHAQFFTLLDSEASLALPGVSHPFQPPRRRLTDKPGYPFPSDLTSPVWMPEGSSKTAKVTMFGMTVTGMITLAPSFTALSRYA